MYEVRRYEHQGVKTFRPFADGKWGLNGVRRVLYGLPSVSGQGRVFLVQGEKCVERLKAEGITATTSCGGAEGWRREYADQMQAAGVQEVVILPDNDVPGDIRRGSGCGVPGGRPKR